MFRINGLFGYPFSVAERTAPNETDAPFGKLHDGQRLPSSSMV